MTINELKEKIIYYNKQYRIGNAEIEDSVYDSMLEDLESKMNIFEFEDFKSSLAEEKGTVKLDYVLGSLSKFKYEESDKFYKWIKKENVTKLFCSEKINGVSYYASYRNGKLVQCTSKGDSIDGTCWTEKAKYILPTEISHKQLLDIRGEFVLFKSDSEKLGFKNALNGTIGIMNRDAIEPDNLKYINAYVYEILSGLKPIYQQFTDIVNLGFNIPKINMFYINDNIHEDIKDFYELCKEKSNYDIDGIVCSDFKYINENVYAPKGKIAFKVNSTGYPTIVKDIEWNVSKNNSLKPVLIVEPVIIDGSVISRCTSNNAQWMIDNGLGIGSEILLIKSGSIIPKCIAVTKKVVPTLPNKCPICNATTIKEEVELKCSNPNCVGSTVKSLESFIIKCGVENVSEKTLLNWNIITFEDLLNFIPNSNYKSEVKFAKEIQDKIFSKTKEELFACFSFDGAGSTIINKLIEFYGNGDLIKATENLYRNPIKDYPSGIGEKIIDKIHINWYNNLRKLKMIISDLRYSPVNKPSIQKNIQSNISGKTFCCTGTLSKGRKEIEKDIIDAGGKIASVSKSLNYLVVGDDAGSKLDKAKSYGIKILTEDQLMEMI